MPASTVVVAATVFVSVFVTVIVCLKSVGFANWLGVLSAQSAGNGVCDYCEGKKSHRSNSGQVEDITSAILYMEPTPNGFANSAHNIN